MSIDSVYNRCKNQYGTIKFSILKDSKCNV